MFLEAYAKINWSLDITGVRDDGYHLMDMIMQPVSLFDEITISPARCLDISTSGWPPSRADESNLAYRAAEALKNRTGYAGGAQIHVHKHIPIGAGLGGGSSDASAVLVGLNDMWKTGLSPEELEKLGLSLGADVPFFVRGGLNRTRGIGEVLEKHESLYNYWLILIQPCPGLSTAQVFSLWRQDGSFHRPDTDAAIHALETGNLEALCTHLGNVLQPVSERLRPEVAKACCDLSVNGSLFAGMTGSGSAVFGVFRSPLSARKAYAKLSPVYKTIFLCHTQHDSVRITD